MFDTVEELAGAVTAVLGPVGQLTKVLTDALDTVWAEFFGSPTPPGGTNWNAYSHEQLYRMLWQDADVGDVSAVAAEWGRHGTALTGFADALRGQAAALRSNWQGRSAEAAADRLAELSDRIWNAGARAGAVGKAVGDAGDALALARNTMPPPPPDPMTLMTSAVGAGPLSPLEAVAVGGARLFTADAVAGASKAEAVRVMQRYEASLRNSGQRVVPAQADATTPRTYPADGLDGGTTSAAAALAGGSSVGRGVAGGGVPWARLVGGAPRGSGGLVGIGPGPVQSVLAAESAMLSDLAAKRAMGTGGFWPAGMAARAADGEQDQRHRSRLPNVDNRLFALDERASAPVIGDLTDKEHDVGR
ncbi:MAG TPA: hypothetical protein VGX25_24825 [Actinophytocola sp.]|uniref:WXG100 family type VII secretion target n=1 Tax=Actinophytocola sp. TaxID=1872138 RepID=UPI002DDDB884|nr:hypothetical protein [Actinophytocola sp.]HEV2782629.1 hypothetical protein [Actinophytocola sp.]